MVVYFGILLHIYQPITQIFPVFKQIVHECYGPLFETFKNHPESKVTLNINAVLTEQLVEYDFTDIVSNIQELATNGQLEFTGSAKFHPLLPLLPKQEISRQIELNTETNQQLLGNIYLPKGFFPPEMAISEDMFPVLKQQGFQWVILSGIANTLPEFPTNYISSHPSGIQLLFRDDYISSDLAFNRIQTPEILFNRLRYRDTEEDYYIILAMDGETFGHHIKQAIHHFLNPLLKNLPGQEEIQMVSLSSIVERFSEGPTQYPKESSWSTSNDDLDKRVPFPLWRPR